MKKKSPSKAFLEDLKAVFEKHNWPGDEIGITKLTAGADNINCPPGKTPHEISFKRPDGSTGFKTVCL